MDHMRILGTEPSSVIFSKTKMIKGNFVLLNSSVILFHKTDAAHLNDFLPYMVVPTCCTCKIIYIYIFSFSVRQSCKQVGAIPCTLLNASMAIVLIRRDFNDGILTILRRLS